MMPTNLSRICITALAISLTASLARSQAADVWQPTQAPIEIAKEKGANDKLLALLRLHDQALDQRTIEIDKHWIEKIVPLSELMDRRRHDPKAPPVEIENAPKPYDQPHRLRHQITFRGDQHTMRIVKEMEPRINDRFGNSSNDGFAWSNADGELTAYAPKTKTGHRQTMYAGNILDMYVRSFQWSCGFGFGRYIQEIETINVRDDTTVLFGQMRLLTDDETRFTIYLDQDWIVRKAIVAIPAKTGGTNEYVVLTEGKRDVDGAPSLATSGHFRRILRPEGKRFKINDDYKVTLVSVSARLTDQQYEKASKIEIPPGAMIVDMRSLIAD